jgi:hypothetical protein
MDKILVAVFEEPGRAHEAVRTLRALDATGCIDVFATSVIAAGAAGASPALGEADEGPLAIAVRVLADRILLALARPPKEAVPLGLGDDLVHDVARRFRPGGSVLVAELWEQWLQPTDAQLSGGVVLRRAREDVLLAEIERDRAALEAESAELERLQSRGDALEARITAVEDGIRELRDRARAALAAATAEHDAKMDVLMAKRAVARAPVKAGLDVRISERLAEHRHRAMALMRAASSAASTARTRPRERGP